MSERDLLILNWLDLQQNGQQELQLQPITNDASQRKYYRCAWQQTSYIVMDSAKDPSFLRFIALAKQLLEWGLTVPKIYQVNYEQSLILMSDLGQDLYLQKLTATTADSLYLAALQALLVMQKNTPAAKLALPKLDAEYLKNRMEVFQQWFLQRHLGLELTLEIQQLITNLVALFHQIFTKQPQVLVHLDYHSRNLLALPAEQPGILDFQDACFGPITYDVVSLLQDAYITWPREQTIAWLLQYQTMATKAGLLPTMEPPQFIKLFDLVGLQRHLKNLGIFARLHYRDGKANYLPHLPTLLQYILDTCRRYPELADLLAFFSEQVELCKQ